MLSDRVLRRIERLLDEADEAVAQRDWALVRQHAQTVLDLDPDNADAGTFLAAADRAQARDASSLAPPAGGLGPDLQEGAAQEVPSQPASFCDGRYEVKRFLGEGGKKRVYLAHDAKLDRDVAFALIKTEGLDAEGLLRIQREAQAMGRLGDHPHIVSVHDIGEEDRQPYIVAQLMPGGDTESLIEQAEGHRVPLETALRIADEVCRALEHAHSHGIVHRDLKPGNVWLTADGTAKLGDFGLALALDRSRLTQAGMMVGTVHYMPPEQAIGGEITPRSDLYALGAMLYELVTGRPPFIGDESVAVITQHLNTPPVAPSWHVPDLPPGLEALILRLLEKDPAKRPASAAEVRQALAALTSLRGGPADGPATSSAQSKVLTVESPIYRRIFVGREPEIKRLQAAFDGAISGQGSLQMVIGEPGIGKTALCEQLATYVAVRGGRTLVGHCYEEGSLSLPYLPFVEAMRTYVLAREPDALRQDLGSGAEEVARIVSEVRHRTGVEPSLAPGDPEEERWRLLQAVTTFLGNAGAVQPLLIVLEDLHWADRGTLDLLVFLSRHIEGARLLVVGTYRDVEVDRTHPLSAALADLRRISAFDRVLLRGLTPDEVSRMMAAITGQDVRWSFAQAVHRQTEGNPLFIQEVLRYLVEEGVIHREAGRWQRTGDAPPEMHIPEGLRDVIGKRLSRLSPACGQVLSTAAVIGRDFALDTLRLLEAAPTEETLLTALEEATHVGVVEDQSVGGVVRFRFAHAFFRQTLYEEIFTPRRLRLHQEVARALERQYAARLEEHAAELAEHFAQSSDPADLAKAVEYGDLAARRAMGVYAHGEAVHHLEHALLAQEVLDPNDHAKRCDLLLALAEAQLPLGEPPRVFETIGPEAFALAEARDDRGRASRACRLILEALHRDAPRNTLTPQWRQWAERADRWADPESSDRAYADVALARAFLAAGDGPGGIELLERALSLARRLDDPELLFTCAWQAMRNEYTPTHWRRAVALAQEFVSRPRDRVSSRTVGQILEFAGGGLLADGDRAGAERAWREMGEVAQRSHDAFVELNALSYQGGLAIMDGQLEEAVITVHRMLERGEELGSARLAAGFALVRCGAAFALLGRIDELEALEAQAGNPMTTRRAWRLAQLGRRAEGQARVRERVAQLQESGGYALLDELHPLLEAAILVEDREATAVLSGWLADSAPTFVAFVVPRLLGAAALVMGDRAAARAHYQRALEVATQVRFRPELALTHLGLAELMLDESREQALQHLDFAIEEFRAMNMQPALERALKHKGLLTA